MYTLPSNATRFYQLWEFSNTATQNWFGIAVLIMFWVVAFFGTKNYDTPRAFAFASTITMMVAILLRAANLVNGFAVMVFVIMASVSVVYLYKAG